MFSSICLQYAAVKGKYLKNVTVGMTSSSKNKFYCSDVWPNMSVCPIFPSPVYFIYMSIHPPAYLHIHSSIHHSVTSHEKNEKEKMRILGKSNIKKSYRGLCGVEVMGQKLRESVKRHFEFRTCRKSDINTCRPNIAHIVLHTVMYEVLTITVLLNLTTCNLIEICRSLRGTFCYRLQGVLKK
jgi:hypothetical protein